MAKLIQEETQAKCEAAVAKYLAMDEYEAMFEMSYEIQGWIASRAARGHEIESSVKKVLELVLMMIDAQKTPNKDLESEVVKRYQKQGGKL
jgi:2-oxo-4-hydroxy-4-carboxy--5-ureidoimidazoline (OHCU) decarboxylase